METLTRKTSTTILAVMDANGNWEKTTEGESGSFNLSQVVCSCHKALAVVNHDGSRIYKSGPRAPRGAANPSANTSAANTSAVVQKVGQKVPTFQDLLSRYTSNAGNLANLRSRLSELEKTVEADKANLIAARDIAVAVNVEASKAEETHKATCDKNAKARAALIAAGLEDSAALIVDPPSPSITRVSIPDLPF